MDQERAQILADEMTAEHKLFGKKLTYKYLLVVFFISLFILVTGMVGTESLRTVWQSSHAFATRDVPVLSQLYTLEEVNTRLTYYLETILDDNSTENQIRNAITKFNEYADAGQISFVSLEALLEDEAEKTLYKQSLLNFENFLSYSKSIEESVSVSNLNLRNSEIKDLYEKSILARRSAEDNLFELAHVAKQRIANNANQLSNTHSKMRQNLLYLTLFGLSLATVAGILLGRRVIIGPVLKAEEKALDVANLNSELNSSNKQLVERDIQLSEVNKRLKEIDSNRTEFVSIVAHQLRTPLAGIKWTLDMLINGDIGEMTLEQKAQLMKILDTNERIIRFVTDLLSISRIESGRLEYKFSQVNLNQIAESVLLDIYPLSNKKQITVNFRAKGITLPLVAADTDKIMAVFQNVLENAVKYCPVGGHVTLDIRNKGTEIQVSVSDDGPGIPKDEQKNIFKRFYRAPSAVKMQSEGSGLGLYLAKAIVEGHGGKIWFESEANRGSTFYFTIPIPKK